MHRNSLSTKTWRLYSLLLDFGFKVWVYFYRAVIWLVRDHPGFLIVPAILFMMGKLYWANFASATWRQELKLEVAMPGGRALGSSVVELAVWHTPEFMQSGGRFSSIEGEAVAVDLGEGKWLFALLDKQTFLYEKVLPRRLDGTQATRAVRAIRAFRKQEEPLQVKFRDLPTLVTFSDINDADSMRIVDPADLASVFGDGYALKSATVQATHTPVTKGQLTKPWPCLTDEQPCRPWSRSEPAKSQLRLPWGAWFLRNET